MFLCLSLFFFVLFLVLLYNVHYVLTFLLIEVLLLSVFLFLSLEGVGLYGLYGLFVFLLVMVSLGGFSISFLVSVARGFGRDFWFSGVF